MVDAQALILLETEHPVVPPREALFGLFEEAEAVLQTKRLKSLKCCALRFGTEDLAGPGVRVVHVTIVRRDIEVARQRELRVAGELFGEPSLKRFEPSQLVIVLVAAHGLAVRNVGADDANAIDGGSDQALLWVGEMRVVADDVTQIAA